MKKKKNKNELVTRFNEDEVTVREDQKNALACVDLLQEYESDMSNAVRKLHTNGWAITTDVVEDINSEEFDGRLWLEQEGDARLSGIVPAVAFAFNDDYKRIRTARTLIANTLEGAMYGAPVGDCGTEVLGPVVTPCVVGNAKEPTGIFVPFAGGKESLVAGTHLINSFIDTFCDKPCDGKTCGCGAAINAHSECDCANHDKDKKSDSNLTW